MSGVRQTETVQSTATGPDGAWLFADVAVGQNYELSFALARLRHPVVHRHAVRGRQAGRRWRSSWRPATGSVSGVVVGPGGPLGNVDLVLTDGTLTFNSSTASGAGAGTFSITGVSTPGTYTLTANLRGHGTEVLQLTLEPGRAARRRAHRHDAGVGSISGRVTENGEPLGGVTPDGVERRRHAARPPA